MNRTELNEKAAGILQDAGELHIVKIDADGVWVQWLDSMQGEVFNDDIKNHRGWHIFDLNNPWDTLAIHKTMVVLGEKYMMSIVASDGEWVITNPDIYLPITNYRFLEYKEAVEAAVEAITL
jgi:hypothetical protein